MGAINPFTDFGFKKIFGEEEKDAYEESLKSYRDNINVIDTARKEGREEEKRQIARRLKQAGVSREIIRSTIGLSDDEIEKL